MSTAQPCSHLSTFAQVILLWIRNWFGGVNLALNIYLYFLIHKHVINQGINVLAKLSQNWSHSLSVVFLL